MLSRSYFPDQLTLFCLTNYTFQSLIQIQPFCLQSHHPRIEIYPNSLRCLPKLDLVCDVSGIMGQKLIGNRQRFWVCLFFTASCQEDEGKEEDENSFHCVIIRFKLIELSLLRMRLQNSCQSWSVIGANCSTTRLICCSLLLGSSYIGAKV